jgi:hypothetical protein
VGMHHAPIGPAMFMRGTAVLAPCPGQASTGAAERRRVGTELLW